MPHSIPVTETPEPVLRLLRTVLEEARDLLRDVDGERGVRLLERRIECARAEAALLAPDYPQASVQNGVSGG